MAGVPLVAIPQAVDQPANARKAPLCREAYKGCCRGPPINIHIYTYTYAASYTSNDSQMCNGSYFGRDITRTLKRFMICIYGKTEFHSDIAIGSQTLQPKNQPHRCHVCWAVPESAPVWDFKSTWCSIAYASNCGIWFV